MVRVRMCACMSVRSTNTQAHTETERESERIADHFNQNRMNREWLVVFNAKVVWNICTVADYYFYFPL